MKDFKDYIKDQEKEFDNAKKSNDQSNSNEKIESMVKEMLGQFKGASENDLLKAIFKEAETGYKNGTLKNEDVDRFSQMISPILDDKMRKKLNEIVKMLKK